MSLILNDLLGIDKIKIYQDSDLFNFSIDSILLAHFVTINYKDKEICDLCSGNAPIPMYLTLKTKANITGVEVQEKSYNLANMSINYNHFENQIKMVNANLIGISNVIGKEKYDVVTCNPPYFKIGNNNINPNSELAIARHEVLANLDDIIKEASLLLRQKGRLAIVYHPGRLIELINTLRKYKIEPKRIQFIYPKRNRSCNHVLVEGVKCGNAEMQVLAPIYVYNDNDKWTKQILKIYNFEED